MYKVKPIASEEEIVLPSNMYHVKPIADFGGAKSSPGRRASSGSSSESSAQKRQSNKPKSKSTSEDHPASCGKENKTQVAKEQDPNTLTPKEGKEKKPGNQRPRKKSKSFSKDQGNQSNVKDGSSQNKTADTTKKGDILSPEKEEKTSGAAPIMPPADAFIGNLIGEVVVYDIAIQVDFDYKPLRVLKVINHLRKNFDLRIAVKVHISSTLLVEPESNTDEWRMFETFESTILPRQDNQLIVTLIVKRFTPKESWLNKQPFMILDPFLGTAIYGEVNIARHLTRIVTAVYPVCSSIYPENDPKATATVKDIDETLNEIQKFLFLRDLQDKQARPQIPEIKDKRLKDSTDLDFTLDYILLLSLKL